MTSKASSFTPSVAPPPSDRSDKPQQAVDSINLPHVSPLATREVPSSTHVPVALSSRQGHWFRRIVGAVKFVVDLLWRLSLSAVSNLQVFLLCSALTLTVLSMFATWKITKLSAVPPSARHHGILLETPEAFRYALAVEEEQHLQHIEQYKKTLLDARETMRTLRIGLEKVINTHRPFGKCQGLDEHCSLDEDIDFLKDGK